MLGRRLMQTCKLHCGQHPQQPAFRASLVGLGLQTFCQQSIASMSAALTLEALVCHSSTHNAQLPIWLSFIKADYQVFFILVSKLFKPSSGLVRVLLERSYEVIIRLPQACSGYIRYHLPDTGVVSALMRCSEEDEKASCVKDCLICGV